MYPETVIKKIESLRDTDQSSIRSYKLGNLSGRALERMNGKRAAVLKKIIAKHGFPFKTVSSKGAYRGAVLIVQHSGDTGFMEKVSLIFSAASDRQIDRSDLAYLIDRIKILKGLPQVYGTQYREARNGKIIFFEIEDERNANRRRKKMGMGTLARYRRKALAAAGGRRRK